MDNENWEEEYREHLNEIVKDGSYNIGTSKFVCYTGKAGYIDFLVEIRREFKEKII